MGRDDRDDELLKDKNSVRVPLIMMDAAARHRPGFRFQHAKDDRALNCDAYNEYDERIRDEYKNPNAGKGDPVGTGTHELQGSREGQSCTHNGWPGKLVRGPGGQLFCQINPITGKDADFKKPVASIRDAFSSLARNFGLVDDEGEASWESIIRIAKQMNELNGNDAIVRSTAS